MRWLALSLITGVTALSAAEAQMEHGAFVMTLGKDTVAIDQYARTARSLDGVLQPQNAGTCRNNTPPSAIPRPPAS